MKPNLFIVRAPKCTTTSLHNYLKRYLDICGYAEKKPNYFNRNHWQESDDFHGKKLYFDCRKKESYLDLFDHYTGENVVEEASVWYLISKVAAENIQAIVQIAKFW